MSAEVPPGEGQPIKNRFAAETALPAPRGSFELPPFDDPKYRNELGDDITDEQATEFLRALDFILRTFVDLGWGVDAVQLALPELAKFSQQSESLADFSGEEDFRTQKIGSSDTFNTAAREVEE